jgi:hypothetical protein
MKKLYLSLAILGAVIPCAFFFGFFQANGINVSVFVKGLFANGASGGFTADLLISSFVFWLFMFVEAKRGRSPSPYIFIALNLTIGLSCALPTYLYAKEP